MIYVLSKLTQFKVGLKSLKSLFMRKIKAKKIIFIIIILTAWAINQDIVIIFNVTFRLNNFFKLGI